ncbi:MAG: hypothetical protein JW908_07240 [Anaerolineales bacterium]|nr:hypothetical protein [Anaerolineales bacterium]
MKTIKFGLIISIMGLLTFNANSALSQGSNLPSEDNASEGTVASTLSYQGRLTNPTSGAPLSGTYDLEFTFWTAQAPSGSQVGATTMKSNQSIVNGLYSTSLNVSPANINGQELWLQIRACQSGGTFETLSPRIQVLPTAYALSLRPGATIAGSVADPSAIIMASNNGSGVGLYGYSANDTGVYGETGGNLSSDYGVYGHAVDGVSYGVYGYKESGAGGLGVYGKNEVGGSGVSGLNAASGNGTWGYSDNYNGVGGGTGRVDSNYGLYTTDNLYSSNYHTTGAILQVVQNDGKETLELGDVVVVTGIGKSLSENTAPIIRVSKASEINSTGVLGVVASSYSADWLLEETDPTGASIHKNDIPLANSNPIAPGEYLLVVVQGPAQVKASAVSGAILAGDLLSCAEAKGYAVKASHITVNGISTTIPGTVFGKALEALDEGQDLIYVFVTLQ